MFKLIFLLLFINLPSIESTCSNFCGPFGYCLETEPTTGRYCLKCACPSGYSGECCDVGPADACANSPCGIGNYQCNSLPNSEYQCVCASGYFGPSCEYSNAGYGMGPDGNFFVMDDF